MLLGLNERSGESIRSVEECIQPLSHDLFGPAPTRDIPGSLQPDD